MIRRSGAGFSLVEVIMYTAVAGLIMGSITLVFQYVGRQQKNQSGGIAAQNAFVGVSDYLQKDVTGCSGWTLDPLPGGGMALSLKRMEETVQYELADKRSEIVRRSKSGDKVFSFWGDFPGPAEKMIFEQQAGAENQIRLIVELRDPPLHLERNFTVRLKMPAGATFFPQKKFGGN